jgi:dihydroneopterin aldolase
MTTPDLTLPVHLSLMDDLRLHCRKLFLRHHEVQAQIGAHTFEKIGTQRLWLNVELWVPLTHSTPSQDALHEVVDYDFVRHEIAQRLQAGHVELQETLCDDLVQRLLAHPGVRAVRLSTAKPDVYPDCEAVGVEVFRIKPSSDCL